MKISYKKLWIMPAERDISNISQTTFSQAAELSFGTMSELNNSKAVRIDEE